ncbi:MAG: hypothetical protein JNK69_06430 [Saprospiraceae bacterium]|nr:hypothetical protein [Candidatus Vicinibacter proximus]MBL7823026.1 hypothetical protein [Saprospiraceae bacterium]MCC6842206.1 hypothetical protein [Saprospiraceae bacterium]HRG33411.1 hypothetical protein [Saprospiraceae bacterium]
MALRVFFILIVFLTVFCGFLRAQSVAAVFIQGNVKVFKQGENVNMAKALVHGPLLPDQKLIVAQNSKVKLLKSNGEVCEISNAGTYTINSLKFIAVPESSIFSKLGDYFLSFFTSHTSSETKENYSNTVLAFSRGEDAVPILNFPMTGMISADLTGIDFKWTHPCDSCNFILQIYDFESKALVFQSYVNSVNYTLKNPLKYLFPGKKYFWNIQLDKSVVKSTSSSFTVSKKGDFNLKVTEVENNLNKEKLKLQSLPHTLMVMSALRDKEMINYAFQFASISKSKYPKDKLLADYLDKIYYTELSNRLQQ